MFSIFFKWNFSSLLQMTLSRTCNLSVSARLHREPARQNGPISSIVCLCAGRMKPGTPPAQSSVMKNQQNKSSTYRPCCRTEERVCGCSGPSCPMIHPQTHDRLSWMLPKCSRSTHSMKRIPFISFSSTETWVMASVRWALRKCNGKILLEKYVKNSFKAQYFAT